MYFKNYLLISCLLIGLFFYPNAINAVPARPTPVTITQGNGEKLTIIIQGNEYFNYRTTLDGYFIKADSEGNYYYLCLDAQGNVILSSVAVNEVELRNSEELLFLHSLDKENILDALRESSKKKKNISGRNTKKQKIDHKRSEFPTIGNIRTLVILVEFPNVEFSIENPVEEFSRLLNEPGYNDYYATGSAWDYFYDNSGGKFNPQFDVYGPVMLSQNSSYYHAPIAINRQTMVEEACRILSESKEVDFSEYDMDNDGIVDNVYLFCAGYSAASGADSEIYVWPHKFDVWDLELELNGKRLNDYACSNELRGVEKLERDTIAAIGSFTHEFCHVLGLPDLYVTDPYAVGNFFTPGAFSILDKGCYNNNQFTPCNLTAYERFCIGWADPIELDTEPLNVGLRNIEENEAYWIRTSSEDEFFILENRQLVGWDKYLPAHGMLVWHIDYDEELWINNDVNNDAKHQRVELIRADGLSTVASLKGDPFPGTQNIREFTDDSTPTSMDTWSGEILNKGLTEIKEEAGNIFFRFKGGVKEELSGSISSLPASDVKEISFTANWNAFEGNIFGYLIHVSYWNGAKWTPLKGYSGIDTGNSTYYTLNNLEPGVEYRYKIAATDGFSTTQYSEEVTVKTNDVVTFEYFTPNVRISDIGDDFFSISWPAIPGANSYWVDVYQKEYGDAQGSSMLDFSDGVAGIAKKNWTTNCTSTLTPDGYYGEAAPALRFDQKGQYLQSPTYKEGVSKLKFWYAARNASSENSVLINAYDGEEWIEVWRKDDLSENSVGAIVELGPRELGNCQVISVVYNRVGSGELYIDDIEVEYGAEMTKVEIEAVEVSAPVDEKVSFTAVNLKKDEYYYYTVTGLSTDSQTRTTKESEVLINKDFSSIEVADFSSYITIDKEGVYIKVSDNEIKELMIYDIMGNYIYSTSFSNEVRVEKGRMMNGVYIIRIDRQIHKVVIR